MPGFARLIRTLAWALCLAASLASAKTETVSARGTGFGDSAEGAVSNALIEAARQTLGVSVLHDPSFRSATFEWVETEKLGTGRWRSKPENQAPSLANVESYRVIGVKEIREQLWQAEVEAKLLKPASIGPDKSALPSLVVAPVRAAADSYDLARAYPANRVAQSLQRSLVQSFTGSGRVRILERNYPNAVANELAIAASGLSPYEHAKIGQQLGADLIMTTEIEAFQLGREANAHYGSQLRQLEPFIRVHYQLIDVSTREIISAGTWVDQQSENDFIKRLREADIEPAREKDRVGEVLYPYVARHLSGEVLDALYPLRVLSAAASDAVYITQGAGRLGEGDLLSVRQPQQTINDPDTGLAVQVNGPVEATLRVLEVAKGYARAELVTGELAVVNAEAVLHIEAQQAEAPVGIERPLTPGSSEAPIQW